MKMLERIQIGRLPAPRRTLLFGVHGVGKTTFGASAPSAVIVATEDGQADVDCHRFPLCRSYAEMLQAMGELYSEEHDYLTAVVDSLDWAERLVWTEVCRKRGIENIEDAGYGKGYVFALDLWRELLAGLDALRCKRGMAVILISHARIERFEDPETDSYDRFVPRLHKSASYIVQEWCDEVLFACYRVHTKLTDEGFGRRKAKGLGTGERIMRTSERPSHVAKNRLNLPDELPLDYRAYAHYFTTPTPNNGEPKHG